MIILSQPIAHFCCSFGPSRFNYQAFACYDLSDNGKQKLSEYGVWTGDKYAAFFPLNLCLSEGYATVMD
jgi:hypothetical protein